MCRVLHRPFAKGGTLFYGACLQECPLLFQQVLRHAQCVVQTSHPGKFTTLRAVSLRVWLETQHDLYSVGEPAEGSLKKFNNFENGFFFFCYCRRYRECRSTLNTPPDRLYSRYTFNSTTRSISRSCSASGNSASLLN